MPSHKPAAGTERPARRATSRRAGKPAARPRTSAPASAPVPEPSRPGAASAEAAPQRPRRAVAPAASGTIRIEQYRSGIGCIERQKRTLRALGLRRPRHRVVRTDNPAVRGMVRAIPHLVRIVEGS